MGGASGDALWDCILPEGRFTAISAAKDRVCGLEASGRVSCIDSYRNEVGTEPGEVMTDVSVGDWSTCTIRDNGELACWFETGVGTTEGFDEMVGRPEGEFRRVWVGRRGAYGIRTDGSIAAWGDNLAGPPPPDQEFVTLAAGDWFACGLGGDGELACWGSNEYVAGAAAEGSITGLAAASDNACAIREDGSIVC